MDFILGINSCVTYLPKIVELDGYEVGVKEIFLPTSLLHSGGDFEIGVSTDAGLSFSNTVKVKLPESSLWPQKIVSAVADSLSEYASIISHENGKIQIETVSPQTILRLPLGLAKVLGLDVFQITNQPVMGTSIVSNEILSERILVTCNFVTPQQVNGRLMQYIYSGPPSHVGSAGDIYCKTLDAPFYCVRIGFYNVFWEPIHVPDQMFTLLLHFRKS